MEVEDALSAKFRSLIEGLMVATTAEIVKMFSKLLTETRVEISRSWKEIDSLKQKLEECELQKTEAIIKAQMLSGLKREDDDVEISQHAPGSDDRMDAVPVENRSVCEGNANTSGTEQGRSSDAGAPFAEVEMSFAAENSPNDSQGTQSTQTGNNLSNRSSSISTLTVKPKSNVAAKRRKLRKNHAFEKKDFAHALRDRQHLSTQRRCMCCTSDECYVQTSPARSHHRLPSVYVCRKCNKRFKTHILFKSHKCPITQSCDACGHIFVTIQGFSAHSQDFTPPFICNQCEQTFATQCAWNLHKKIHPNDDSAQETKENIMENQSNIKSQIEVRLERISESQLEAALCTKGDSLLNNLSCASSTSKAQESDPGVTETISDSSCDKSIDRNAVYASMSTSTSQRNDALGPQSPKAHGSDEVKDEGRSVSGSDVSELCSPPRRRKTADCNHDAYNGVFPVEKILKWRNNKGKSEVRVKWMPCSLCGAKFQNTWEPAENFPDLMED